ncbi:MAG: hypothetical protein ACKVVP_22420 [Chloroflexota bacterium]
MTDHRSPGQPEQPFSGPPADLKCLDRLVGNWKVSGPDIDGHVSYEWMDGKFFLIQRFDLVHGGMKVKGIEIIGHLQPFGEEPGAEIRSRVYDTVGNTFDYVYEIDGDTLTIWGGEKGSPAYYRGAFSADGNTNAGAWVYPGGGGYASTMTRTEWADDGVGPTPTPDAEPTHQMRR